MAMMIGKALKDKIIKMNNDLRGKVGNVMVQNSTPQDSIIENYNEVLNLSSSRFVPNERKSYVGYADKTYRQHKS